MYTRVLLKHARSGYVHDAGQQAKGATAYVTLEPCNHYGKTPPCSQALVDAQVAKVIAVFPFCHFVSKFCFSPSAPLAPSPSWGACILQTGQTKHWQAQ